ncbi:MAG: cell division protein ZapA [Dissulfuribacterales bacterium]
MSDHCPATVRLDFFGQIYELKADEPDVDMCELVDYLNRKIDEIETSHSQLLPHKRVVLAFLSIGKDYIVTQKKLSDLETVYSSQVNKLVSKIDSVIAV